MAVIVDRVCPMRNTPVSAALIAAGCVLLACALPAGPAEAQAIRFQDRSANGNMTGYTESWGASVGDLNGDRCPDLFINGHRDYPRFYRNTCDGSFEDIAYEIDPGDWIANAYDDKHGAAWGDFDNDGDEDLLMTSSATGPALLMVNENGRFVERAGDADLANDSTARMAVWFDYTRDGRLDVSQTYLRNAFLRRQDPAQGLDFDDDMSGTGFSCPGSIEYAQLSDLNNNGSLEIICAQVSRFPNRVFDTGTRPFTNVTSSFPSSSLINDSVIADFNNDLRPDVVVLRGLQRPSGAVQTSPRHIASWLRIAPNGAPGKGFNFVAPGQVTFTVDNRDGGILGVPDIFELNSSGPNSADSGPIRIRFQNGRWVVTIVSDDDGQAYVQADSVSDITGFTVTGIESSEGPLAMRHFVNGPSGLTFVNTTGLTTPVSCVAAVAGDFDNDMWTDLYLVCREGTTNTANRVYRNRGNGTFQLVTGHGGEGPTGTSFDIGVGENVVTFDYDGDGFLDLSVLNGLLFYPAHVGGPDTLLRNTTNNGNHWLEFDLRGTTSNRQGVGAKVFVTAGGLTQLREQNGGYHRSSQNHQRLHFGLAGNQIATTVRVEWPSGTVATYSNVAADRLYELNENGTITARSFGPPVHTEFQPGDECGEPPYQIKYGPIVQLWRDCPGTTWHMRAKGGRESDMRLFTNGTITGDAQFGTVSNFQLQSGDKVTLNAARTQLTFSVNVWFTQNKGFNVETGGQSSSCLELSRQDIPALIVGARRKRLYHSFDLVSLDQCAGTASTPPPTAPDPACGAPTFDRKTEVGVYVWRNCDAEGPDEEWHARFASGGTSWSPYEGAVTSDMPLSAAGVGLASPDQFDATPDDNVVEFQLWAGGSGVDGFDLQVAGGAQACMDLSRLKPGAQVQVGAGRQVVGTLFDLHTLGPCN